MVNRKDKKRSSSPNSATQIDHRSRSFSPRTSGYRNQSCSPPPERMPTPKALPKVVYNRRFSKQPERQSHDPSLNVFWSNVQAFSKQTEKRDWQEGLVQSTERPRRANVAFIRKGVHISKDDPDRIQHITVDYQRVCGKRYEHITTWHIDLTEAEYQFFMQFERSEPQRHWL
jgi:hypothetical protein